MSDHTSEKLEQRIRFVTRHYSPNSLNTEKAWKQFSGIYAIPQNYLERRIWIGIAASLIILIGCGTWWFTSLTKNDWALYEADNGIALELWLPDSTQVTLAPHATLRYNRNKYGLASRDIELNGKAFFDVRRNPEAPFSVLTRLACVTVLGTSFQVNEKPKEISVNVISGKVRFAIDNIDEEAILTGGMSGVYTAENRILEVNKEQDRNEIAWKTKELQFRDTPLPEVIRTLEEYYNCKITRVKTASAKDASDNLKLTATLRNLSLREALLIINKTLGIRLTAKPAAPEKS